MSKTSTHDIVIIGASYAGLAAAHGLLQKIIPSLDAATKYKVTMISASSHFFFTVGAPRAILAPYPVALSDSFIPVEQGFAQYPAGSFAFVQGSVGAVDTSRRVLSFVPVSDTSPSIDSKAAGPQDLHYDSLIIASGATSTSPLWSLHGTHLPTVAAFEAMHASISTARSILIVGGGPAGTETAGQLGSSYGTSKSVTLLSGSSRLLPNIQRADIGQRAQKYLEAMNVAVRHNVKTTSSEAIGAKTRVNLSNGESMTVDIFIDATGRRPNTAFLDAALLNARKTVLVDEHFRVKGAGPRVYAFGDAASNSKGGVVDINFGKPALLANIQYDLSDGRAGADKEYKPSDKDMQLVPVGKSKGVGVAFGWWFPSFFVWLVKGRNFMFPKALQTVNGTA